MEDNKQSMILEHSIKIPSATTFYYNVMPVEYWDAQPHGPRIKTKSNDKKKVGSVFVLRGADLAYDDLLAYHQDPNIDERILDYNVLKFTVGFAVYARFAILDLHSNNMKIGVALIAALLNHYCLLMKANYKEKEIADFAMEYRHGTLKWKDKNIDLYP